jgi:ABC-type Fe3+-hydroxamate transport system substrate-binding protein
LILDPEDERTASLEKSVIICHSARPNIEEQLELQQPVVRVSNDAQMSDADSVANCTVSLQGIFLHFLSLDVEETYL